MNCLILGANGQDGSFLAERLSAGGDNVEGWGRQETFRHGPVAGTFRYRQVDLRSQRQVAEALAAFDPDEIYCVAAVHGSAGFNYEPVWGDALDVNTKSTYSALEHARNARKPVRIFYGSSAKVFGDPLPETVTLDSARRNQCLYSITKNTSENLIQYYRDRHGIEVSVGVLFNHESRRRTDDYFLPRLCTTIARAVVDPDHAAEFRTLDFYCDWGSADEFMGIAIRSVRARVPITFLLATGKTVHAESLVKEAFGSFGLDYRKHVRTQDSTRPARPYRVDLGSLIEAVGAPPEVDALELCRGMVNETLSKNDR